MTIFRSVNDSNLIGAIQLATKRVVFFAPGVSQAVCDALISGMLGGRIEQFVLVLDGDEDTCRLGYCDAEALGKLSAAAKQFKIPLKRQPGLRLGFLMADDEILVWTPTPLMVEANRHGAEPNGMALTAQTFENLPKAVGVNADTSDVTSEIGTLELHEDEVAKVVDAMKAAPAAPFDLTRLCRVFSSKFQFIETTLRGAELIKRELQLDSLVVNSDAPKALRPLLHTTVHPFATDADKTVVVSVLVVGEQAYSKDGKLLTRPTTQAGMRAYWEAITDRYLINLPGFGKIIRLADKTKFEDAKKAFELVLKEWVTGFRDLVIGDDANRVLALATLIESRVKNSTAKEKPTRIDIENVVRTGLASLRVIEPSAKVIYKNITVESTRDIEFTTILKEKLPKEDLDGWYHSFDAAPTVQSGQS